MQNPLPFLVAGLVTGSVYGLAGMGLALAYRLSRVLNFAHGAVAMVCAFSYWQLHIAWGWPTVPALAVAAGLLPCLLAVLTERFVFRHLGEASVFARTAATVGVLLVFYGLAIYLWTDEAVQVPTLFPSTFVHLPGVVVSGEQIGIVATVAVLAGGLFAFIRFTATGLRLRAVVDNPGLAEIRKVDTRQVNRLSWTMSYLFAAVSGVLLAPLYGSNPLQLTLVVVYSLVALVIGGMVSLPITLVGGLVVGLSDALALGYLPQGDATSRVRGILPFALLFIALVAQSRRFAATGSGSEGKASLLADLGESAGRRWEPGRLGLLFAAGAACGVYFLLGSYWAFLLSGGVAYAMIFLSYKFFTSVTGMVSLAQGAFAGIGAFVAATMVGGTCSARGVTLEVAAKCINPPVRLPWALAVVAGGLAAGLAGAIVAIPTVRLRGIFLVLATVAFAQLVESVVFNYEDFTGGTYGRALPRPGGFESDFAYLLLLVAVFLVLGFAADRLRRSGIGKELQAHLGTDMGARSIGIRPERGRLIAFLVAAAIAGVGGALFSGVAGRVSVDSWNLINALLWLTVTAIGGIGSMWGALFAGVMLSVTPEIIRHFPIFGKLYILVFGLVGLVLLRRPGGLVAVAGRIRSGFTSSAPVRRAERRRERAALPPLGPVSHGRAAGAAIAAAGQTPSSRAALAPRRPPDRAPTRR